MKSLNKLAALGAAAVMTLCFGLAQASYADTITLTQDTTNYTGAHGAGEFGVSAFSGATVSTAGSGVATSGNAFQTFCLEGNEHVALNTSYNWTLSTGAVAGGYSGGNPDPIGSDTAYLFHQFWAGTLTSYTYTQGSGRTSSANSLQLAIWSLEGELGTTALTNAYNADSQAQAWVSAAQTAVANGTWTGTGNVRVLNLTSTVDGSNAQSVLVETQAVPLPSSALLGLGLMAGLTGVGVLRKRRRNVVA